MHLVSAWRENNGVKPISDQAQYTVTALPILFTDIFFDHSAKPVKLPYHRERQAGRLHEGSTF
jgi:hypothetical protein